MTEPPSVRLMPARGAAIARRVAQVMVAIVAVGELRDLVTSAQRLGRAPLSAIPSIGSAAFWVTCLLAIGAGLLLREMTRGLTPPRPDHSGKLMVTWACCSAALLGVLSVRGFTGAELGSGLPSIAIALTAGLLLAASLQGTRLILRAVARGAPRAPSRVREHAPVAVGGCVRALMPPAPLLAGWSDRGPPLSLV